MVSMAILVPSRNRPQRLPALLSNIRATTADSFGLYFAVTDSDSYELLALLGVPVWRTNPNWSAPERLQFLYEQSSEDVVVVGSDDIQFFPGWWESGSEVMAQVDGMVALTDSTNAIHSGCFMFSRRYLTEESGAPDEPNVIGHRGYHHNYHDTELREVAESRGRFGRCEGRADHLHHSITGTGFDETYARSTSWFAEDEALFNSRRHLWGG
jgi:hypothetical protein